MPWAEQTGSSCLPGSPRRSLPALRRSLRRLLRCRCSRVGGGSSKEGGGNRSTGSGWAGSSRGIRATAGADGGGSSQGWLQRSVSGASSSIPTLHHLTGAGCLPVQTWPWTESSCAARRRPLTACCRQSSCGGRQALHESCGFCGAVAACAVSRDSGVPGARKSEASLNPDGRDFHCRSRTVSDGVEQQYRLVWFCSLKCIHIFSKKLRISAVMC